MRYCRKALETWTGWKLKLNKLTFLFLLLVSAQVLSTASVPSLNQCPDMIFIDGIENESMPSNGVGGVYPGSVQRTTSGGSEYYIYIPSDYVPNTPMPIFFLWHGAAGAGNADGQAQAVRSLWDSHAETGHFIIVSQVGTGSQGNWVSSDVAVLNAIVDDMQLAYNIETSRMYLWGFSAGGHWMHALGILYADRFAAYAINAGDLRFATANNVFPADAIRQIPVYVSIGSSDPNLPYAQNDRLDFLQAGWIENRNFWLEVFTGGHTVPNNVPNEIWEKICISTNLN